MKAYERFLKYITVYTTSDPNSASHPSTARQFDLANLLAEEMRTLGIEQVSVSENCYVYGMIPATKGYEDKPALGFIAHMDTSPDASGENVCAQVIHNYDGGDVLLEKGGLTLSSKAFPHLKEMKGRTLITTDGTSLLGADDKAGIAEILTACEEILASDMPHGKICVAFTPDEEVGSGTDCFDIPLFGADFAYTLDGGKEGELEYENFNAASADFAIKGFSIHPGTAKNKMINASLVAMEINALLPTAETPALTENYEGFYHLTDMSGSVSKASLSYLVRDHDACLFEARKHVLRHIEKTINEKYGDGTVTLTLTDSYRNMKEALKDCMHLIEHAKVAMERLGVEPIITPIRGGTDGCQLSYKGLPCPNLGTGGFACHGEYEHITAEGMDICANVMIEIIRSYAE